MNTSQIIGPQKLGNERRRCREARREAEVGNLKKLSSFYFDGKKSMTRVLVKNNQQPYVIDDSHNTFVSLQALKHLYNTVMNIAKEVVQGNAFFAYLDKLLLAMCTDKEVAVRRKAVNKVRNLQSYCIPTPEDEELADVKADDERPNIDKELLILTDDEVNEDADATEKSRKKASKTLEK